MPGTVAVTGVSTASSSSEYVNSTSNALHTEPSTLAAERNVGSATNGYNVIRNESNGTFMNNVATEQDISGGVPAHLMGVYLPAALTGNLTIKGFTNLAGTATNLTLTTPAAGFYEFKDARIETSLRMTKTVAGNVVLVFWRPI